MSKNEVKSTHDDSSASGTVTPEGGTNHKRPKDKNIGDKKADTVKGAKASVVEFGKVNKEEFSALFAGLDLSEDFHTKAFTLFEAAVIEKVQTVIDALEEQANETVEEQSSDFEEKLSDFIDLFAEQYMKENELAIDNGIKAEVAESLLDGMKDLFFEHNIEIPAEKVDIVESLTTEVQELQDKLNKQMSENVDLTKKLYQSEKEDVLESVLDGVDDVTASRVRRLAENLTDRNVNEFKTSVTTFLEAITNKNSEEKKTITEESEVVEVKESKAVNSDVEKLNSLL